MHLQIASGHSITVLDAVVDWFIDQNNNYTEILLNVTDFNN